MTITEESGFAVVKWTPGVGDENEVYNDIVINAFDGTDTSTRTFNVRVYPTL